MFEKKHICNLCEKRYKTPQSLCNHKKLYHNNLTQKNSISTLIPSENTQNSSNITQLTSIYIPKNDIIIEDNKLICNYCNKEYSRADNLKRHMKTCKSKDNIIKQCEALIKLNEDKDKEIKDIKQSFEKFKKQMIDMMNQKYKMHPKTFQKMVNSTNNSNNFSNNNITINNIKYVEYGKEELYNVFSEKEKIMILKKPGSAIENIIKYTHLNDKYPQLEPTVLI